jgi:hypothetical protein
MNYQNGERAPQRQRLFQFLVPLVSCVLTVVAIELGLAIFHPIPFSIETNMYFESDPYTGWRLKPHGAGYYQLGIPGNSNSHGHRDVEVPLKKPPGVFRIMVLGDSFTVGSNVRQEEAFPKALERRLRNSFGPHVQVVNAGTGGWEPFQYAQYFEHYGYRFEPDLILIGFFVGNDSYDDKTKAEQLYTAIDGHVVSREEAAKPFIRAKVFLYDHSHIARLLLNRGPVADRTFIRQRCEDFTEQYLAIQKSRMPNHLRDSSEQRAKARNAQNQIRRIKDQAGATPVVIALLPDENQINKQLQDRLVDAKDIADYDFKMPQSMLIEMFRAIGLPVIDALPAFLADKRCLYMNDTHWTPEGHELAASVIFDQLAPVLERMKPLK